MPRQHNKEWRVLGPYKDERGKGSIRYQIVVVGPGGRENPQYYPTQEEALQVKRSLERKFEKENALRIEEAMGEYMAYLRRERECRPSTVMTTSYRLDSFFQGHTDLPVTRYTPALCEKLYQRLVDGDPGAGISPQRPDTHRRTLSEVKTFFKWLVKRKKALSANPAAEVEPVGKKRKRKAQLSFDEAVRWREKAHEFAGKGEPGPVAALFTLLLNVRASEVVQRVVRDLDRGGTLLHVPYSKTEAGERSLLVPEELRGYLTTLCSGKKPEDPIFRNPHTGKAYRRQWVYFWVRELCRRAKVKEVGPHAMRGLHSSLAIAAGVTPEVVARAMGHVSPAITREHYIDPEIAEQAQQVRVFQVFEGGSGKKTGVASDSFSNRSPGAL